MTWHRPEEILNHPEYHSRYGVAYGIVRILVVIEWDDEKPKRFTGWYLPNHGGSWRIEGSKTQQKVLAWMPMPEPPEWVTEAKP